MEKEIAAGRGRMHGACARRRGMGRTGVGEEAEERLGREIAHGEIVRVRFAQGDHALGESSLRCRGAGTKEEVKGEWQGLPGSD